MRLMNCPLSNVQLCAANRSTLATTDIGADRKGPAALYAGIGSALIECERKGVFHAIQYELHWAAVTRTQGKLPSLLTRLHQRLVTFLNDERPGRHFDRAVKALPVRYAVRVLKMDLN
jgi:hypothetical protein